VGTALLEWFQNLPADTILNCLWEDDNKKLYVKTFADVNKQCQRAKAALGMFCKHCQSVGCTRCRGPALVIKRAANKVLEWIMVFSTAVDKYQRNACWSSQLQMQ